MRRSRNGVSGIPGTLAAGEQTGLFCEVCGQPQIETPSGVTCPNGHGGAGGTTRPRVGADDMFEDRGPDEDTRLVAGDEVTWTAGKETFCPIKFHVFEVGPVTASTRVRPGESAADALTRVREFATTAWDIEYEEKLAGHLERVRRAAGMAKGEP